MHDNDDIEHQLFKLLRRTNAIHVQTSSGEIELERSAYAILCLIADDGPQRLGSIASASLNRKLATALVKLAPPELEMAEIPFKELPL